MFRRYRALDLFCGGGGVSRGLYLAGFSVVGVDIERQRHYPYPFKRANALDLDPSYLAGFDFIWASPPCQRWTAGARQAGTNGNHPDLIEPTRQMLSTVDALTVIENIPNAPVRRDLILCGSMFGLRLIRHRAFELKGFWVKSPAHLPHALNYFTVTGSAGGYSSRHPGGIKGSTADWQEVMGIDWLPNEVLVEAIPPVYSEYIGEAAIKRLGARRDFPQKGSNKSSFGSLG